LNRRWLMSKVAKISMLLMGFTSNVLAAVNSSESSSVNWCMPEQKIPITTIISWISQIAVVLMVLCLCIICFYKQYKKRALKNKEQQEWNDDQNDTGQGT
jgi:uncharacterized BrkB/YihY/UPF0761 family membrane protein